nr:mucin-16 [Rattus norvegicus]
MSQLTDLTTEEAVKAETTATALKVTSIFNSNTKMSTANSRPSTHLKTSEKTTNINTAEMIITASDTSQNLLEIAPSFSTGLRENTSMISRRSSPPYSREPEITIPYITSLKTKTIPNVYTLTAPSSESDTISWITHDLEITSAVAKTTTNASQVESDSMVSIATNPRGEHSSNISTAAVFPAIPDLASIEQVSRLFDPTIAISSSISEMKNVDSHSSKEDTRTSKPILTNSPSEPYNTISLISYAGGKTGSPMSTITVSPDVREIMRPLFPSSGNTNHTRNQPISQGQSKTTTSWITHPGTEVTSRVLTTTISPNIQEMVTSKSVNPTAKLQTTTSLIIDGEEHPSLATSTRAVPLGVIEEMPPPLINMSTEKNARTSTLDFFLYQPETTTSWTTNPEKETILGIHTTNYSPSVTDRMTSINLNYTPSEPESIKSLDIHVEGNPSTSMSIQTVLPSIREMMISQATNYGREKHISTSALPVSLGQRQTTASLVNHAENEATSEALPTTISTIQGMSSTTRMTSEPHTTASLVTHNGEQHSSDMSTLPASSGITKMKQPLETSTGKENQSVFTILAVSLGVPKTKSINTTSNILDMIISKAQNHTSSDGHTITSLVTHAGTQSSLSMSTEAPSSSITKLTASLFTDMGKEDVAITSLPISSGEMGRRAPSVTKPEKEVTSEDQSITISNSIQQIMTSPTVIPTEPHTIVLVDTHFGDQPSSAMSTLPVTSDLTKIIPSLSTRPGTESHSVTSTMGISEGQLETTTLGDTHTGREGNSLTLSAVISTSAPDIMISTTKNETTSDTQTITSLITLVEEHHSLSVPTQGDSPGIMKETSSLFTDLGTESYTMTSTLPVFSGQPNIRKTWVKHSETEVTAGILPTTILTSIPEIMASPTSLLSEPHTTVSLISHVGGEPSLAMSTLPVSGTLTENIPSEVNYPGIEGHSMTSALDGTRDHIDSTDQWVSHHSKEGTSMVLYTTISTSAPDMVVSINKNQISSDTHTVTSFITQAKGQPSLSGSTQDISPAIKEVPQSIFNDSDTESYAVTSTLPASSHEPETRTKWIPNTKMEDKLGVLSTTISSSTPEMMISPTPITSEIHSTVSLFTHVGEQDNIAMSSLTVSPSITKFTATQQTHTDTESHTETSALNVSTGQAESTTTWLTQSAKKETTQVLSTTSPTVSDVMTSATLYSTSPGTQTITSFISNDGEQSSLPTSTQGISPGITKGIPSLFTNLNTESYSMTSTMPVYSGQPDTMTLWDTNSEKEVTAGDLATTISSSVLEMKTSKTTFLTESHTTIPSISHVVEQHNPVMSTLPVSTGIKEIIPSQGTHSDTENHSLTSALNVSAGQAESTTTWLTQTAKRETSGVLSRTMSPTVPDMMTSAPLNNTSPSTQTITSFISHDGEQPSLSMSTQDISAGMTEGTPSLFTALNTKSNAMTSNMPASSGQTESRTPWDTNSEMKATSGTLSNTISYNVPEMKILPTVLPSETYSAKVPLVTEVVGQHSSVMSTLPFSPGRTESIPSLETTSGTENYSVTSTLDMSIDQAGSTTPWGTHTGRKNNLVGTSTIISTTALEMMTSISKNQASSETQTITSFINHAAGQPSLSGSTQGISSGIKEMTPSLFTDLDTDSNVMTSTMPASSGQAETRTPLGTTSEMKVTSGTLSTTISYTVPQMMASATFLPSEPHTTVPLVTHVVGQPSSVMSTLPFSPGRTESIPSLEISSQIENYSVTSTLDMSIDQAGSTTPWATHTEKEGTSGTPSSIISTSAPDRMTSITKNQTSSETQTISSLISHDEGQHNFSVYSHNISPGIREVTQSLFTDLGKNSYAMNSTLPASSSQAEIRTPWDSNTEMKDTSGTLSTTISYTLPQVMTSVTVIPSEPQTATVSLVTHAVGQPSSVMSTLSFSPGRTESQSSLVISSDIENYSVISTLDMSIDEGSTTPWGTHTGREGTSGTPSSIISTSVTEMMPSITKNQTSSKTQTITSFISHDDGQPSISVSTKGISPGIEETTPSLFTDLGPDSNVMTSAMPASSGQAESRTPWDTTSEMKSTSGTLSTTISHTVPEMMTSATFPPSETHITNPIVIDIVGQPSSVKSTLPSSPSRTESMPSMDTSSHTENYSVTSTFDKSIDQAGSTNPWNTHTDKGSTSGTLSSIISTSAPEMMSSITKDQTSSETQTITSFISHDDGQPSISVSNKGISPGIEETISSLFTDLGPDSNVMTSAMPASSGQAESRTPWDTTSEMKSTSGTLSTTISHTVPEKMTSATFPPSETHITNPIVIDIVGQPSSVKSTLPFSPSRTESMPSMDTSSHTENYSVTSTFDKSIDQAGSTNPWNTHTGKGSTSGTLSSIISTSAPEMMSSIPKNQTSSATQSITTFISHDDEQPSLSMSTQGISPGTKQMTPSPFTDLGPGSYAMASTLPASSVLAETRTPWDTTSEMKGTSGTLSTTVSYSVPEMTTSATFLPSEPHTTIPIVTHVVGQPSSVMSTLPLSPSRTESMPSMDTSSHTENYSMTSTLDMSIDQAGSTNPWNTHTDKESTSGTLPSIISTSAPEMMSSIPKNQTSSATQTITSFISHDDGQSSLSVSTKGISPGIKEMTPSSFTDLGPGSYAMASTLLAFSGQAETRTPWDTTSEKKSTSGTLSTTISYTVPEMVTSATFLPSETHTTIPIVTHVVGQPSSVMSTLPLSPSRTESMPSMDTSSHTENYSMTSTLDMSIDQAGSTNPWNTHTDKESTSGTLPSIISTSAPEMMSSIPKNQTSSATQTITSFISHDDGQSSLSVSTKGISPGIKEMTPSSFTDLGPGSYAMASTLLASSGQVEARTPWDTTSEMKSTYGTLFTTVSYSVPEMTTSATFLPSEPHTTIPIVTHVVGQPSSVMSTLPLSPSRTESMPSMDTSSHTENYSMTSTLDMSIDQAGSTNPWNTHTDKESTSGTLPSIISTSAPEMMSSIPKNQTSSATQTITSFISHDDGQSSLSVSTKGISPGIKEMTPSSFTDLGPGSYAMASTLLAFSGQAETRTPWDTTSEKKSTSGTLSTTISYTVPEMVTSATFLPSETHTTIPIVTHLVGQPSSVMSTLPLSPSRTESMPSLDTSSHTENYSVTSTLDMSIDQAGSTTAWAIHTEKESTSGTPSTIISTSAPDRMTSTTKNQTSSETQTISSFISHDEGQPSLSMSTPSISPLMTEVTQSLFTDLGTDSYAMTSTLPTSSGQAHSSPPWDTNSEMKTTSATLSTTILSTLPEMMTSASLIPSEPHSTVPLFTHVEGQPSSVLSTLLISPGITEVMSSLVTSSATETNSVTYNMDISTEQPGFTTPWGTHSGKESTSRTLSTIISTSAPDRMTSITQNHFSSDTQTTESLNTHGGGYHSLLLSSPNIISDITRVTPELFTTLSTESYTVTSILPASPDQGETTAQLLNQPVKESPSVVLPTTISTSVSEVMTSPLSELHTIDSLVTHVGGQLSSMSNFTVSPGITEIISSQDTSYVTESHSVTSVLALSPSPLATTSPWETHPSREAISEILTINTSPSAIDSMTSKSKIHSSSETQSIISTVTHGEVQPSMSVSTQASSPSITEVTQLLSTDLGTGNYSIASTLPASLGQTETKAPSVTNLETEVTSGALSTIISTIVSEMMTSSTVSPHTTASLVSHVGEQPSSTITTLPASPDRTEIIPSLVTHPGTTSHIVSSPLDISPGQAESTAPWVTHSGNEGYSGVLSTTILSSVPGMMTSKTQNHTSFDTQTITSFITHAEEQDSLSLSTQGVSPSITEVTPSLFTELDTEKSAFPSTLPVSVFPPGSKTTSVTHPQTEVTSGSSIIITANVPDMMSSPTLIPSDPHTTVSLVTHVAEQPSSAMSILPVSPSTTETISPLVTHSGTESHSVTSTLAVSSSHSETTPQWITHTGHEGTSGTLPTTTSSSIPDIMTSTTLNHTLSKSQTVKSLFTHVGGQPSLNMTTMAFSPSIPKLTTSPSTKFITESHPTTVALSSSLSKTTASLVTPQMESTLSFLTTTIPSTILEMITPPSLLTSELHTTISLATPLEGQLTSSTSTLAISSGVTEKIPLLVTSSTTEIYSVSSTLDTSPGLESPDSMDTTPKIEATSNILSTDISPSVPDLMSSPTHIPFEPHATLSLATYVGEQSSSNISTLTHFPGIKNIVTPLATTSLVEPHTTVPTLSVPADQRETTALSVTHSGKEVMSTVSSPSTLPGDPERTETWVILSAKTSTPHPTTNFPFSYSDTTSSASEVETSSVTTLLSGASEEATSLSVHIGTTTSTTTLTVNPSSILPGSTGFWPSSPSTEYTLTVSSLLPGFSDHPTTSKSSTATSQNIEMSPSLSTIRHSDFVSDVISPTVTLLPSESSTHALTDLETTNEATHSATTSSRPTEAEITTTLHGSSFALLTTSRTSTLSPENVTSRPTTSIHPELVPFIFNLTITNLPYTTEMGHPNSLLFNRTEAALKLLLQSLFINTSIGAGYSGCKLTLIRSEQNGTATGVDTICTYHSDPMSHPLDREKLYQEVTQLTNGITRLGPCTLDKDSLYINGYNHRYWIPTTSTTSPSLVHFTLNFTITNLHHSEGMGSQGSDIFNNTERILNHLLKPMFKISSIGSLYSRCRLISLRPEKDGTATGVDAVCTLHSDPLGFQLDREKLYWELSNNTQGGTKLGSFTLEKDSLYINGFTYKRISASTLNTPVTSSLFLMETSTAKPILSTGPGSSLVPFTINFTITNLKYEEGMNYPGSWKYNATERILQRLLRPLFNKTSIGLLYSDCKLALLRPGRDGTATATGVDAICTYHADPTAPGLDNERVFRELSNLTNDVTQLGPYTLDKNSLYINGYTQQILSSTATPTSPSLLHFTLNFTITNLHHTEGMGSQGSEIFNNTERILNRLLKPIFKNSSIGHLYSGCRLISLRPEKEETATGVDAVCTLHSDTLGLQLDREKLYWELNHNTQSVTKLGSFTLEKNSLYINGFTYVRTSDSTLNTPVTSSMFFTETSTAKPIFSTVSYSPLVPFTINFTITNLKYEEGMSHPGSWKFKATERILQRLLRPLLNKTSISLLYSDCKLALLRPGRDGTATATGVDAICTYHADPTAPGLDNERVFRELSNLTNDVTQLGPYTLDKNSLYINGYTQQILSSTSPPGPVLEHFTINFTIINLKFEEDMRNPGSRKFNITQRTLQSLLRTLIKKSSIGALYSSCRLSLLRPENDGTGTGVDAVCTHYPDPTGHGLDRKMVYWEISRLTYGVNRLGPYTLDEKSLYVDGYTRQIVATTTQTSMMTIASMGMISNSSNPTAGPVLVPFTINFTVTNLEYVEDMGHPGSRKFNATERVLQKLLRALFSKTSISSLYSGCRLTLLRLEHNGTATGVDAVCTYHSNVSNQGLDRERLYGELKRLNIMELGPYTLDQNRLYVNGYKQKILATTHRPSVLATVSEGTPNISSAPTAASPVLVPFTINFTITNLEFEKDMRYPGSRKFNITERILQSLLRLLFNKTSAGRLYSGCRLVLLRPEKNRAATGVDVICTYHLIPSGNKLVSEHIYGELSSLTQGVTQLGPYTLDQNSLYVNGYTNHILATTPRVSMLSNVSSNTANPISNPTASSSALQLCTLNFTITNLPYMNDMWVPGSAKFNKVEKILKLLLKPLFQNATGGPLDSGCRLTSLRPKEDGEATRVDMVCTYHPNSTGTALDSKQLYLELEQLTHNITQLGPYTLDQNSLYVNGYTHQTAVTSPSKSSLELFTFNFTITNLQYTKNMQPAGSKKFNIMEKILQGLLGPLFKNTSIGPLYAGCRLTWLSSRKDGKATGIDTVCTYYPDHMGHGLATEQLYLELSNLTHGVTQLGPYTLDQDSLYVNGYIYSASGIVLNTTTSFPAFSLAPSSTNNSTDNGTVMVPITLNFTITNLHYTEEMGHPGSLKFNSTKWILHYWLGTLLNKTSIAPVYSGCRLSSLRSENHRATTGVDIICNFHSYSMSPRVNQDQLFWELSHGTHGITRLGPYTLDQDSLYINGYSFGAAALNTTTGELSEELFTVNFTINNLRYSADMSQIGSPKFNITDTLMQHLLSSLFQRSSLGPLYTGCRVDTLKSVKNGAQTQVDVLCTYHQVFNSRGLPAKSIFYDLSWQTHGITKLGPYSLDKDSLFINGYNEPGPDVPPTTPEPATTILPSSTSSLQPESNTAMWHNLETFTINFTISNVPYSADMISGSAMFNSTENVLQHLLGPLFQNDSFNSSCRLTSLRPEKNGTSTGVVTTCTYQHDPGQAGMDTQGLYSELSHLSHGFTQMGNYTLEAHSLYVNGYHVLGPDILTTTPEPSTTILPFTLTSMQPESTTAREHHLEIFTINFTISNLPYSADMDYSSALFNSTESTLQHMLRPLFQNISFNSSCKLASLRPRKNQNSTRVNIICSYQNDSAHPALHIQELYSELSHLTHGFTQLGNYTLDKDSLYVNEDSLYVNGYNETGTKEPTINPDTAPTLLTSSSTFVQTESTTVVGHHLKTVTVSLTISNLPYSAHMNNDSAVFNSTETVLKHLLEPLLRNMSFNSSCRLDSLRPKKNGTATAVEAICTYFHDPANPGIDTQRLYTELSHFTYGITQLGNYTLDNESLQVNGYSETHPEESPTTPEPATTLQPSPSTSLHPEPTTEHHLKILTINFTISNLPYSSNMSNGSAMFSSTESIVQQLLGHLFQNDSFNSSCRLDSLRSKKNGTATGVDVICTYHRDPAHPEMDIQGLYLEMNNLTYGITQLGNYSLEKNSLYINGYNDHSTEDLYTAAESPTTILPSPSTFVQGEPTMAMGYLKTFTLNFTISNLPYSADMNTGSATFNSTERILQYLIRPLVQNESLYSDCRLASLRPKKNGTATGVNAICSYHLSPEHPELDTQELFTKLTQLTQGVTQLGSYMLDQHSLYVNGYPHQTAEITPSGYVPLNVTIQGKYQINFCIINWNLNNTDPTSSEYIMLERDIEDKVTTLYTGSQLKEVFLSCLVTNMTSGSTVVTIEALFSSYLDPNLVKQIFLNKTLNASSYWLGATYQLTDLHVIDMKTSILLPTEIPTTSSNAQHFNLNFTITNLPYSQDIAQPGTTKHQQSKRSIEYALNQLFRNSTIKSYFSDCQVLAFRSVSNNNHTGVDSLCNFSPLARRVDRVAIYEEFLRMTQNGTQLLNFTLDRKSVFVDGYSQNRDDDVMKNSGLPFWAIILICLAVLLVLITCLMCCFLVTICRKKKEGDYQVQRHRLAYYLSHLDLRKLQ